MTRITPRIAFLFTSSRDSVLDAVHRGEVADTALMGSNYVPQADMLVSGGGSPWRRFIRSVKLLPTLLSYDVIFAQDDLVLGYIVSVASTLRRHPTQWVHVAINTVTVLKRHSRHPLRSILLRLFLSSYARIVCLSKEQQSYLRNAGIDLDRIQFIPFGVDAEYYARSDSMSLGTVILSVGRDAGRDYETLIRALLNFSYPCIIVAGKRNLSKDQSVPQTLTVLRDQTNAQVRELYERAALVVVPSKDERDYVGSDCSGQTVILDALAAGKPVIATRRAWISDYFIEGTDLLVVKPQDPETLANAIALCMNDFQYRKRLSIAGSSKVRDRYTSKKFGEALYAVAWDLAGNLLS